MEEHILDYIPKQVITLREHQHLCEEDKEYFKKLGIKFEDTPYESMPKYLGVCPRGLCASYYIGAQWLNDNHAIVVTPKVSNLDYVEMFAQALKCSGSASYLSKFYGVDLDAPPINTESASSIITPLLLIHYVSLINKIVSRGLKRDYVSREENLQSKIRGKIKISKNIKLNDIAGRRDRVYCNYQEFTVDIPENRILKKALIFAQQMLRSIQSHSCFEQVSKSINRAFVAFSDVTDRVEMQELRDVKQNKLYKNYTEALSLARMILRRYNYSLSEVNHADNSTPPFWIDMARLYEVYVYGKLLEAYPENSIRFQVKGYGGSAVDFIKTDEQIIIDTKYKPRYDGSNSGIIDDVRQLSAYARDRKITKYFNEADGREYPCLIIYPERVVDSSEQDDECIEYSSFPQGNILDKASRIKHFNGFYKISISLPSLK